MHGQCDAVVAPCTSRHIPTLLRNCAPFQLSAGLEGYYRTADLECRPCAGPDGTRGLVLVVLGLVSVAALAVLVATTIDAAEDGTNKSSVLVKIYLSGMQVVSFAAAYEFNWPDSVQGLFSVSSSTSSLDLSLFSPECAVNGGNYFLFKVALTAACPLVLPLVVAACCVLGNFFLQCRRKIALRVSKRGFWPAMLILLLSAHSTLTKSSFLVFRCQVSHTPQPLHLEL